MGKAQASAQIEIRRQGTTQAGSKTSTGAATTVALPAPPEGWFDGTAYEVRVQTSTSEYLTLSSPWSEWEAFTYEQPDTAPEVSTTASAG
jgi:hypothetical protein